MGGLMDKIQSNALGQSGDPKEPQDYDELRKTRRDALKERVYLQTLGIDPSTPHPNVQASEKTSVDLGAIFSAQTELVKHSLDKIDELRSSSQSAKVDPYLQHLETELTQMRQRLDQPSQDPTATMMQHVEQFKNLTQMMKEHLGISQGVQVASSDVPRLIELEQLRQQGVERSHQWDKEDRRWTQEFSLKRLEFADSRQAKDRATGALEDLAGSVIDSIDEERGSRGVAGPGQVRKPKAWKCDCGAVVQVKSPEATDALCESCGAWFDLIAQDAPETAEA